MKQPPMIVALLAGIFCASQAQAEVGITADLGTTGVGAHLSVPLQSNLHARFGVGFLNYSYNSSTDDVDYQLKLKLRTFDALLDYFPTDGAFRVSAGVVYNGNKIDAKGKPNKTGSYTLNGNTYTAASAGQLDGTIDFRKVAPYIGIGWGNAVKEAGWGISSDIGVLFQGAPKTALSNSGCDPLVCAALKTDVAAENAKLADKVKDFKAYPVLRISLSYRY